MQTLNQVFTGLSKSAIADLLLAKSAMTAHYLLGGTRVKGMARAFRAGAATIATHNIVGVGIDEKYVEGVPTGVAAIKFLVRSKIPASALTAKIKLPTSIDGLPTDVEEVGLIVPLSKAVNSTKKTKGTATSAAAMPNPRLKHRPAHPGSSVGFREPNDEFIMAGTFGALVKDAKGKTYILSNNHVLAFENGIDANGTKREALPAGSPIYQPGFLDNGDVDTDAIAELTRWVDLRADKNDNLVDGAIARLTKANLADKNIHFIGPPTGSKMAEKDMIVHKFGRTTSYRAGRVSSVFFDVTVPYEVGDVVFVDQIAIRGRNGKRFSDSGDSGSAILERSSNKVVGLLFAGATNGSLTFCNHISDGLKQLKVRLP